MTRIDFFSNAPNRLDYVARLLTKVHVAGQKAVVFGNESTLSALSQALWASNAFLAHDYVSKESDITHLSASDEPLVAPIILTCLALPDYPHHEVLINLSDVIPEGFAQFHRLIEVVPSEPTPKEAARQRWTHYKNRGYAMNHHDIAAKSKS